MPAWDMPLSSCGVCGSQACSNDCSEIEDPVECVACGKTIDADDAEELTPLRFLCWRCSHKGLVGACVPCGQGAAFLVPLDRDPTCVPCLVGFVEREGED